VANGDSTKALTPRKIGDIHARADAAPVDEPLMGQLAKFVRFCFGLEALSLIAAVPFFLIAVFKLSLFSQLTALGALLLNILPAIAWWTLKRGNRNARIWALAASVTNLLPVRAGVSPLMVFSRPTHLPVAFVGALIGVAGLIAFSRRQGASEVADSTRPKPQRLAGDGTSKLVERAAAAIALVWLFLCMHWWREWAKAQHLSESDFLIWASQLQIAILLCVTVHEFGHVLAGWASHMKLRSLEIGPFRLAHKRGKWKFELVASLGGMTGMAPTRLTNVRGCSAFFALGGPVASLALAGVSCVAAFTAKGHFWEPSWAIFSMMATIASVDFMVNLIPQKPEAHYSDGARIYQLVTNGPWAHVEQAFSIVASTLVTSRRPRDYDLEVIHAAGNFLNKGDRAMLLRLFSCIHHLDSGRIPEAIESLEQAEKLYENVALQNGAGICAEFIFINAVFKRDRAAAELWWQRLQAQRRIDQDAEYFLALAGILWIQGQIDEARQAYDRGYALALELPSAGAYEYTRSSFDALRATLNERADNSQLAEMLTAIRSTEAEVEAPLVTNPAL
jgi:hypothetical protein